MDFSIQITNYFYNKYLIDLSSELREKIIDDFKTYMFQFKYRQTQTISVGNIKFHKVDIRNKANTSKEKGARSLVFIFLENNEELNFIPVYLFDVNEEKSHNTIIKTVPFAKKLFQDLTTSLQSGLQKTYFISV